MNNIVMKHMRDKMVSMLKDSICKVSFTKVNGETRNMTCTLKESVIPAATKKDPLSQKKVRAVNEEVIPVWDTTAEGWRAFRVENVTSFEVAEKELGGPTGPEPTRFGTWEHKGREIDF